MTTVPAALAATPGTRDRYVDLVRVLSISAVIVGPSWAPAPR